MARLPRSETSTQAVAVGLAALSLDHGVALAVCVEDLTPVSDLPNPNIFAGADPAPELVRESARPYGARVNGDDRLLRDASRR
jgi:hypothetical protein